MSRFRLACGQACRDFLKLGLVEVGRKPTLNVRGMGFCTGSELSEEPDSCSWIWEQCGLSSHFRTVGVIYLSSHFWTVYVIYLTSHFWTVSVIYLNSHFWTVEAV